MVDAAMRLIKAERLEPKRTFRCVVCDPPPKRPRVLRRYLFTFACTDGRRERDGDYCLPCASGFTGRSEYVLRKELDAKGHGGGVV
jgi:hypothetical protein